MPVRSVFAPAVFLAHLQADRRPGGLLQAFEI
jgi:hypothetical protein